MHVTRFNEAPHYEAPNHFDMRCLRLQGKEAGPSTQMWMGMSQILPGGHTGPSGDQFGRTIISTGPKAVRRPSSSSSRAIEGGSRSSTVRPFR